MDEGADVDVCGSATERVLPVIDADLVRRLVAAQFPRWAHLAVRPVADGGWDNRTFHLGDEMTVRLPSGPGYRLQVGKEQRWLPVLAPQLPLSIPAPLALGAPGEGYPFSWSIYRWIDGATASVERIGDLTTFATDLGHFLRTLQRIDGTGGPRAGPHSAFRGGPLRTYDEDTRRAVEVLGDRVDGGTAMAIWAAALSTEWPGAPVWVHGDVAEGNLLVRNGRLAAVIDFGCLSVGDPACDLAIAWTLLSGASRDAFRAALGVDPDTWTRGRGWVLWKALITLVRGAGTDSAWTAPARRTLDRVFAEYGSVGARR